MKIVLRSFWFPIAGLILALTVLVGCQSTQTSPTTEATAGPPPPGSPPMELLSAVTAEQQKAFKQNDVNALVRLGVLAESDTERAAAYLLAAELGHGSSQEQIGNMFAEGRGVRQDNVLAYKWLEIASHGKDGWKRRGGSHRLYNMLSSEELGLAKLLISDWHRNHQQR